MLRFDHPALAQLFWVVPLLVVLIWWGMRQKRRALGVLGEPEVLGRLHPATSRSRQIVKAFVLPVAFSACILALMGPQIGTVYEEVRREGVDVIVALDVSASMEAEDVPPSRLARAKYEIGRFIDGLRGDRVGIVGFAGTAYLACPLTLDYGAARIFLEVLDSDVIGQQGTALADALDSALNSFLDEEGKHKAVILVTDGEDHEGKVLDVAQAAAERGVVVHTVGVGSFAGAPIPVHNKRGRRIGFKRDKDERIVTSHLSESVLDEIASTTGGIYVRLTNQPAGMESIYAAIASMEKKELGSHQFAKYEERFQYLVAVALLLLFAEPFTSERRKVAREWRGRFI